MSLLRSYQVLRFALLLVAIMAQCVALGSFSILLIAGTFTALSWYVTEGPRGRSIPPWISRLLVLVAVMFSALDVYGPVEELPLVLGRFVVWLTVIKMYSKRTIENEAQLLILSLLLMAVGSLYATDLLFGVLFVFWVGLAVWVLLLYQLQHGCEVMRAERYKAVPNDAQTPWARPVTGKKVNKVFRNNAVAYITLIVLATSLFFVFLPREKQSDFLEDAISHDSGEGRMELQPDRDIEPSDRQVMSISIKDMEGNDVFMSQGLRLRGNVLDAYVGQGVWETSNQIPTSVLTSSDSFTPIRQWGVTEPTMVMHVDFHQPMTRVYSINEPISIETSKQSRVVLNDVNGTLGVGVGAPIFQSYTLEVNYQPIISTPMMPSANRYQNEEVKLMTLSLLESHGIEAGDIQNATKDQRVRTANIIAQYLRSDDFTYSTDSSSLSLDERNAYSQQNDPIRTFLFDAKRGHCEFFASAMVAMCDSIELPARIVTGYFVDRWDNVNKKYVVLDRDAHAWVEVEVSPFGWETFEPTPSAEGSPTWQEPLTILQSARFAWQRWELAWQSGVVSFDAAAQRRMYSFVKPEWKEWWVSKVEGAKDTLETTVRWFQIGVGGQLWFTLALSAVLLTIVAFGILIYRKWKVRSSLQLLRRHEQQVQTSNVEFYAVLVQILKKLGWVRPRSMPPLDWSRTLPISPKAMNSLEQLTYAYYEVRFGNASLNSKKRRELRKQVEAFEFLLKGASDE